MMRINKRSYLKEYSKNVANDDRITRSKREQKYSCCFWNVFL